MSNARELSQIATAIVVDGSKNVSVAEKITVTKDSSISGLTVGKGGGNIGTNTATGNLALRDNTTGTSNTAIGYQAGYAGNGSGHSYNTYLGFQAGANVTSGGGNTLVGYGAGGSLTTGAANTFIGSTNNFNAGSAVTTGSGNTIVGPYSGNNGGLDIRTASNYIVLSDGAGNPRVIVDSDGYMGIGTIPVTSISNTTGLTLAGNIGYVQQTRNSVLGAYNRTSTNGTIFAFYRQGTQVGSIDVTTTATSYVTSSDYRLKENIAPMTGALAKVSALKPCTYTWKADGSNGQGFIAHELQAVVPNCVTGEKDAVDEEGKPVYQGIDTSFLVATLTAAIQELKAEFDAYKATHP